MISVYILAFVEACLLLLVLAHIGQLEGFKDNELKEFTDEFDAFEDVWNMRWDVVDNQYNNLIERLQALALLYPTQLQQANEKIDKLIAQNKKLQEACESIEERYSQTYDQFRQLQEELSELKESKKPSA